MAATNGSARPWRIWDAKGKRALPWRCYSHVINAHRKAVVLAYEAPIGTTLEVFNNDNGRVLDYYTRRVGGVDAPLAKERKMK